jgi:hypothetical protein
VAATGSLSAVWSLTGGLRTIAALIRAAANPAGAAVVTPAATVRMRAERAVMTALAGSDAPVQSPVSDQVAGGLNLGKLRHPTLFCLTGSPTRE